MNRTARTLRVFAAVVFAAASGACVGTPTLPSSTVETLTIVGAPPVVGATSQYSASVIVANSADVVNVTSLATWQTANTAVATVSKTGLVTGVTVGTTTLTATYNGTTVSQQLSIP